MFRGIIAAFSVKDTLSMDKTILKEQVEIIRQAFGYINQFKGQTFVIKLESSLISHPLFPLLVRDVVLLHRMGINVILVPGARDRINEVLKKYAIRCKTVNGVRVSPPEAIPLIKMAAFDVTNKIMTMLAENGANGVIGNWVRAKSIGVRNGIDFQSSGIVEKVQVDIVNKVLTEGIIPIFPGGANVTGNIAVTGVIAACTLIITTFSGNRHYWVDIINTPGVPWWLKIPVPLMPVVEFISVLTKPFVLMVRLFANMLAGHIVILGFISIIFIFGAMAVSLGYGVSIVSLLFMVFMDLLEVLVALIQAYVFTLLSALYFGLASAEPEQHQ